MFHTKAQEEPKHDTISTTDLHSARCNLLLKPPFSTSIEIPAQKTPNKNTKQTNKQKHIHARTTRQVKKERKKEGKRGFSELIAGGRSYDLEAILKRRRSLIVSCGCDICQQVFKFFFTLKTCTKYSYKYTQYKVFNSTF